MESTLETLATQKNRAKLQNNKSNILTCYKTSKLHKPKLNRHIKTYNNKKTKANRKIKALKKKKKRRREKRKFRLKPQTQSFPRLIFYRSLQSNLFTINKKRD